MAHAKSTGVRKDAPVPVSRPSLYVRLSLLKAVSRLIRAHGTAQAALDALTRRLRIAGPAGKLARGDHRHAYWMSVWMSLARRAREGVL
jgi:hypothetical protein